MIQIKLKILKGFKEKSLGLLFEKYASPVLIETRFGIHTFGLRFPIDVLVLDNSKKVVKIKTNLKQNRIFLWNPIYNKVIELPGGEIRRLKIKKGKVLSLLRSLKKQNS